MLAEFAAAPLCGGTGGVKMSANASQKLAMLTPTRKTITKMRFTHFYPISEYPRDQGITVARKLLLSDVSS